MIYSSALETFLQSGVPYRIHHFVRLVARDTSDDSDFVAAFWTGNDDQTFTIDGVPTLYTGAGMALRVPDFQYEAGTDIRYATVSLDVLPESEDVIRNYDVQNAPITVHGRVERLDDNTVVDYFRLWKGTVSQAPIPTSGQGVSTISVKMATTARNGTLSNGGLKSNASQRERSATDRFREYAGVGDAANDPWGLKDEEAS